MQCRDHVYCSVPRVVFYLSIGYMREPSHDAVNAVCVSTGRSAHAEKLKLSIKGESWLSTEKRLVSLVLKSLKQQQKNWSSYLINCVKSVCQIRIVNKKYI